MISEKYIRIRKLGFSNISDTTAVCLGKLDQSEVSIKTIPLPKYQNNARYFLVFSYFMGLLFIFSLYLLVVAL